MKVDSVSCEDPLLLLVLLWLVFPLFTNVNTYHDTVYLVRYRPLLCIYVVIDVIK